MVSKETAIVQAKRLLAVPDSFRRTALSFPGRVDEALALVDSVEEAQQMLHQADTLAHFARRVKADTEIVNSIQYGKLKIVAKIGELSPAMSKADAGSLGGKGEKAGSPGEPAPAKRHIAAYRKVAAHQTKLDAYRERCGNEVQVVPQRAIGPVSSQGSCADNAGKYRLLAVVWRSLIPAEQRSVTHAVLSPPWMSATHCRWRLLLPETLGADSSRDKKGDPPGIPGGTDTQGDPDLAAASGGQRESDREGDPECVTRRICKQNATASRMA